MATTEASRPSPIQFRPGALIKQLAERTGRSGGESETARRDLQRYYQLLADERDRVDLTEAEWNLIRDACNGTLFDEYSYRLLWAEIADAISDERLDQKWQVSGEALVDKLRRLTPGQTLAVVDAVERWWLTSAGRSG